MAEKINKTGAANTTHLRVYSNIGHAVTNETIRVVDRLNKKLHLTSQTRGCSKLDTRMN